MVEPTGRAGVYVHVPFCVSHCPYCDFTVAVVSRIPHVQYADCVIQEWRRREAEWTGRDVRTLYLGGGTPALLDVRQIARIIAEVSARFVLQEVTLEANPDRLTPELLRAMKAAGVTRLSLGTQSFDDTTLQLLGRAHSARDAQRVVREAQRAGFERMSVDLITCVPGEPEGRLRGDLNVVDDLEISHLSAYELTIEPKTAFAARIARGEMPTVDEDKAADDAAFLAEHLAELGLKRYEVGNFCRAGHESLHNSAYWVGHEYIGLGAGAHSLGISSSVVRRQNTRSLRHYLDDPLAGSVSEVVDAQSHLHEVLMTALRTTTGVEIADLVRRFPACTIPYASLRRWREQNWVVRDEEQAAATDLGLSWSDAMAAELFAATIDASGSP